MPVCFSSTVVLYAFELFSCRLIPAEASRASVTPGYARDRDARDGFRITHGIRVNEPDQKTSVILFLVKGFAIGTPASLTVTPVTLLVSLVRIIVSNGDFLGLFPKSSLYILSVVQGFGFGLKLAGLST